MKSGAQKNQNDKPPPLPAHHKFHRIKRHCQRQIIPHRAECLKIISKRHEQEKGKTELVALLIQSKEKKEHRHKRIKGKHQQEIFISRQPVYKLHQKIKADLRGHIGVAVDKMHKFHISGIVVPYIQSACGKQKQNNKNRRQADPVTKLLPGNLMELSFGTVIHKCCKKRRDCRNRDINHHLPRASLTPVRMIRNALPTEISRHMVSLCASKNRRESGSASFP